MADHKKISRRQALSVAVAGGTAATFGSKTHAKRVNAQISWDFEADTICVGSGAASLAAASTAATGGASVIVLESRRSRRDHSQVWCRHLDTQPFWLEGEGDR